MAHMQQKQLIGEGLEQRKEAIARFMEEYESSNNEKDNEPVKEYLELLCEDIRKSKTWWRVGYCYGCDAEIYEGFHQVNMCIIQKANNNSIRVKMRS